MNRPLTPTLSHAKSGKTLTPKNQHNKENRTPSPFFKTHLEQEIINEHTVTEGQFKKTVLSVVLNGKALQTAAIKEKAEITKEKKKKYPILVGPESALPNMQPTKTSTRRSGPISCYSACTNRGIVRSYNEDRISIILNMSREKTLQAPAFFFGLYDGHGGDKCCDFLRDRLHSIIERQSQFPDNPVDALRKGIKQAEYQFLSSYDEKGEKSGSTLLVTLIIGNKCYIANVGDCRAVLSSNRGKNFTNLTRDHKPSDEGEQTRILKAGGKIFHTLSKVTDGDGQIVDESTGPLRVLPGRLSVSRTIGDAEAKLLKLGGNSSVVISEPEITVFQLAKDQDFIIMCTDGIFDKLSSEETITAAWRNGKGLPCHEFSGKAVENVIREGMNRRSVDNLSAVLIGLSNLGEGQKQQLPKSKTYTSSQMKTFLNEGKSKQMMR